jgi:hypothetical protein
MRAQLEQLNKVKSELAQVQNKLSEREAEQKVNALEESSLDDLLSSIENKLELSVKHVSPSLRAG